MRKVWSISLLVIAMLFSAQMVFSESKVKDSASYSITEKLLFKSMLGEITDTLYSSFVSIPQEKFVGKTGRSIDGIAILPIKGEIGDEFYNLFKTKVIKSDFDFYEKQDIEKLLNEQGILTQDFYSQNDILRIGQLTQWKGIIVSSLEESIEHKYGKKRVYINTNISMYNLETGRIIWSEKISSVRAVHQSNIKFILIVLSFFVIGITINVYAKGSKTTPIFLVVFLLITLYSIWFWLV